MRRLALRVSLLLIALILVVLSAALGATWATRRRAADCLRDALSLKVGGSTMADAQAFISRYGGGVQAGQECTWQACVLEVRFRNTPLYLLRIARPTEFVVGLKLEHGVLTNRDVNMAATNRYSYFYASATDSLFYPEGRANTILRRRGFDKRPAELVVFLGPTSDQSLRQAAYSFNLGCLNKIGGCRDSREFLPNAWDYQGTPRP